MREKFISIYNSNIKRAGSQELLAWLISSDFFTAPASTKFHGCYEGGLAEHSINVRNRLLHDNEETRAICGLLHDVCKVNFYKLERKSRKTGRLLPSGKPEWEDYQGYTVEEKFVYGHGEKSVFLIERFMKLTVEEAVSIRYHMGLTGDYINDLGCSATYEKYPLALELHIADLRAAVQDESQKTTNVFG
jgi:hypothetical protein